MTNARGFTLVEVLVALVATALIAIATSALFDATLGQRAAQQDIADRLRRLQIARVQMAGDLDQVVLRPVRDPYGMRRPTAFEGGAPTVMLTLVRGGWNNPGDAEPRASLQYVEYRVEDGALIRRARTRLDVTPDTPAQDAVLLRGIERAKITFFDGRQWVDRWRVGGSDPAGLPSAVALDMTVTGLGDLRQLFRTPRT